MTMSGAIPYSPSRRVSAMSTVSTAGCCDLGAAQLLLGARHRRRVRRVGEDDVGQPPALEQRRHDRVGLLEELGDHRLAPAQLGEHVRVLRALAGVEERHLARGCRCRGRCRARAAPARRPGCPPASARSAELRLRHQVGAVGVVDRDPLGRAQRVGRSAASDRGGGPGAPPPARCAARWRAPPRRRRRARARRAAGGFAGRGAGGAARRRGAALDRRRRPRRGAIAVGGGDGPGTYSSMTTWKLVPPKPNALTPATRARPAATSQSRSSVLTANGDAVQSTLGLGRSKLRLGGSTLSCSASVALSMPAAPAAPLRWPMFDFTEPSAIDPGASCAPREGLHQAAQLDHVADARRGAVALDRACTPRATAPRSARPARPRGAARPGWAR